MTTHESNFSLVTDEELQVGLEYAAKKDMVTLRRDRLRVIINSAGQTRRNDPTGGKKLTPREVVGRAIKAYERRFPAVKFRPAEFEGYVHAGAKILAERNPNTRAKRRRDAEAADILAASYGVESTPDIDPKVNREIALGMTGDLFGEKEDE